MTEIEEAMTNVWGSNQHIASQLADLSEKMVGHEDAALVAEAASRLMHPPALPAALDVVIAAVEAWPETPPEVVRAYEPSGIYETFQEHLLRLLRALRDAPHSPSAPPAQSDTGETEGGS